MSIRHTCLIAITLLCAAGAFGQVRREPQVAPTPDELKEFEEAHESLRMGNPKRMPMMLAIVERAAGEARPANFSDTLIRAVDHIGNFADKRGAKSLRRIVANRDADQKLVSHALQALGKIGEASDTEMIVKRLADESIRPPERHHIAGVLAAKGNAKAIDFLLAEYRVYLKAYATKQPIEYTITPTLESVASPAVIEKVEVLLQEQKDPNAANAAKNLLQAMRVCSQPMEALVALAADASEANRNDRSRVIRTIAEIGTPEHIPLLASIKPYDFDPTAASDTQNYLRTTAAAAVYRIQQRHAAVIAKSGKKLLVNVEADLLAQFRLVRSQEKPGFKEGTDRLGSTIAADGTDFAKDTGRLQLRLAANTREFHDGAEMKDPFSPKMFSVRPQVLLNENGLSEIVKDQLIELRFKPEVMDRMQQLASEYPMYRLAIVFDGKLVAIVKFPAKFGPTLSIREDAIEPKAREAMLKLIKPAPPQNPEKAKPGPTTRPE